MVQRGGRGHVSCSDVRADPAECVRCVTEHEVTGATLSLGLALTQPGGAHGITARIPTELITSSRQALMLSQCRHTSSDHAHSHAHLIGLLPESASSGIPADQCCGLKTSTSANGTLLREEDPGSVNKTGNIYPELAEEGASIGRVST
ncbi:hypothetical protein MHYP_G00088080 [Metynnis hypsauchen]